MTSRVVLPVGQVFVMEATFTDADTGELANPTAVTFTITRIDYGGRYVKETYAWAGANTQYITNESVGVFRGVFEPPTGITEFQAKMVGTGAVTGGSETIRVLLVP